MGTIQPNILLTHLHGHPAHARHKVFGHKISFLRQAVDEEFCSGGVSAGHQKLCISTQSTCECIPPLQCSPQLQMPCWLALLMHQCRQQKFTARQQHITPGVTQQQCTDIGTAHAGMPRWSAGKQPLDLEVKMPLYHLFRAQKYSANSLQAWAKTGSQFPNGSTLAAEAKQSTVGEHHTPVVTIPGLKLWIPTFWMFA